MVIFTARVQKTNAKLIGLLRSAMYPGIFCEKKCALKNVKRASERFLRAAARLLERCWPTCFPAKARRIEQIKTTLWAACPTSPPACKPI